jgi:hypothetical protein
MCKQIYQNIFKNSRKWKCYHHVACLESVVIKYAMLGDLINLNNLRAEMTWFKFAKMHA